MTSNRHYSMKRLNNLPPPLDVVCFHYTRYLNIADIQTWSATPLPVAYLAASRGISLLPRLQEQGELFMSRRAVTFAAELDIDHGEEGDEEGKEGDNVQLCVVAIALLRSP